MKTAKLLAPLSLLLALTACGVLDDGSHHDQRYEERHAEPRHNHAGSKFECVNGLIVEVQHSGQDRLTLIHDGKRANLKREVSASGERYAAKNGLYDKPTEWHQKGNEAFFQFSDPYGNNVETTCRN